MRDIRGISFTAALFLLPIPPHNQDNKITTAPSASNDSQTRRGSFKQMLQGLGGGQAARTATNATI